MNYFDVYNTDLPIIKAQHGTSELAGKIGTAANKIVDTVSLQFLRRKISDKIRKASANSNNNFVRAIGSTAGMLNSGIYDIVQSRVNNTMNRIIPGWVPEKASEQIGKGEPVWTVDKGSRIARYYDKDGNLVLSSPAGVGLVEGEKTRAGDNKTPTGTFRLSAPENGKNKPGGSFSFGKYFWRTNHKNNNSDQLSGVGLHGTGRPFFNGTRVSHGCVRLDNSTIKKFYELAPKHGANTKVVMYDELGGEL